MYVRCVINKKIMSEEQLYIRCLFKCIFPSSFKLTRIIHLKIDSVALIQVGHLSGRTPNSFTVNLFLKRKKMPDPSNDIICGRPSSCRAFQTLTVNYVRNRTKQGMSHFLEVSDIQWPWPFDLHKVKTNTLAAHAVWEVWDYLHCFIFLHGARMTKGRFLDLNWPVKLALTDRFA